MRAGFLLESIIRQFSCLTSITRKRRGWNMSLLNQFLNSGLQFILMVAVVVGAVVLGATLRKKKDEAKKEE